MGHVAVVRIDGKVVETEHVITPDGAWMREKDPAYGEVFLMMDRDLSRKLKEARAVLAGENGATFTSLVPTQLHDLVSARQAPPDGLRCALVGGAGLEEPIH